MLSSLVLCSSTERCSHMRISMPCSPFLLQTNLHAAGALATHVEHTQLLLQPHGKPHGKLATRKRARRARRPVPRASPRVALALIDRWIVSRCPGSK